MTKLVACRMCLTENMKTKSIRNTYLQKMYQKLTNSELITKDWRPDTVCCICYAFLQKYCQVRDMALKAESILTQFLKDGIEFSQQAVCSLNGGSPLSDIINEKHTEYDSDFLDDSEINTGAMEVAVKEEQIVKQEYDTNMFEMKIEDVHLGKHSISNHVTSTSSSDHVKTRKRREPKLIDYKQIKTNLNAESKLKHIRQDGGKIFICDICKKSFTQMGNLNRHKRLHTGGKPYVCNICNKTFAERVYLKVHRKIHTGEKRFSCKSCDKTFVQKCNLQRHERIHSGEKPFSCSKCHKTFSDMSQLKCHVRFHTKEKPYACDRCGMRFSNVSNFNSHMRTHTGEKPYACNICYKHFPRSTTLKSHMLIHTGEKPYDCGKCNKKFNSSKYLKRHMRVHTGEKPYACDICDKTFTVKKSLKKHMTIHTGEKLL